MAAIVVDASVVAKWYVPEEHSDSALTLLAGGSLLHAPQLLVAEFANVLARLVRRATISAEEALRWTLEMSDQDINLHSLESLRLAATTLALAANHPAYDCFYLALALNLDGQCVTADRRFYEAFASRYPDTMVWIEDLGPPPNAPDAH
jgi:predicted nucleic acid-binding protein